MTIILESFRRSMNESDEFIHGPDVISTLRGAEDRTEIVNAINDIDDEILKEKAEGIVQKGFDDGVEVEIIISKLINTIKDSQPDAEFDDFGSFDEPNPFTDSFGDFGDEPTEDGGGLIDNEPVEDKPVEEEEAADDSDFKFEALIRHNLKHRRTASYERNILGESYDDTWKLVDKKQVLDYDGFYTEYAWYSDGNGKHIFMFGDTDIYEPDEYDADHVVEGSYSEAEEWFLSYEGAYDDEDDYEECFSLGKVAEAMAWEDDDYDDDDDWGTPRLSSSTPADRAGEWSTLRYKSSEDLDEGAEGKQRKGYKWIIYQDEEPYKIVAVRSTHTEAQAYILKHLDKDLTCDEVEEKYAIKGRNYDQDLFEESLNEDFWNSSHDSSEFMEFVEFEDSIEPEFNEKFGTTDGWNSWSQEQRDEFCDEVVARYLKDNYASPLLLDDLLENNFHSEWKAFKRWFENHRYKNESLNEANMFNQHYRYEVHAPRGQNYVVGGSKDLEGASQVAINFIEEHILDNPWEKLQDKITRINDMYIYDSDEDEIVEVDSFEDYVDRLLSELYSRKNESLEEDTEEVKKLKSRLNDINNAIEKGADPERLSYEKGKIMDRLEELGETNFYESLKFSDMYDNVYVEFRDGEPTFAYETLGDASYGMSMSMSGDFEHDLGSHEYTIMKLEDGVYYPVKGYEPISGINESLEETDLKGIYFFNQGDRVIRNHEDESYADYYTEEEINAITIYPATPKLWNAWLNDEDSSLWPVYDTHNGYSTDPVRCKDREEAREYLEELLNFSIYEYNHDI